MKTTEYLKTRCPVCRSVKNIIYSMWHSGNYTVRQHKCLKCGEKFKSEENTRTK